MTKTVEAPRERLARGAFFAGRYRVIEALGAGGMGEVYRVEDTKVEQDVALKLLRPEIAAVAGTIERFRRELTSARMIAHRNVCRMFDLGEDNGTFFITMEFVPGEDLKSFIRRSGRLAVGTALRIAGQVGEGLAEAHRLGVVHRDLKPSNIMIDRQGNARIMDFGIARSPGLKSITREGLVVGTPEYMSPEQAEGEEADPRSDIYALGAILYEMVTGRAPFEGTTPLSLAMKHKLEAPQSPRRFVPELPAGLDALILRCLEKDRTKRYQSADELRRALDEIGDDGAAAEPSSARPRVRPLTGPSRGTPARNRRWAALIGGTAVVLALAAVGARLAFRGTGDVLDSIAVLPVENENADPETDYLCDGITESLINKLSQLTVFKKVISRASSFALKGEKVDPRKTGRELGVKAVLATRLVRHGETISISPALIKTSDDSQIWGERYRRGVRDIFAVEEEITTAIVGALKLELTGEEKKKISERRIDDVQAYEFYLKAKREIGLWTKDGCDRALRYLEKGLEIMGENALINAGIGYVYYSYANLGLEGEENGKKAESYAAKALTLDPASAEAHLVLGLVNQAFFGDPRKAVDHLKKALAANPYDGDVLWWLGIAYDFTGKIPAAERMARRMAEFDPLNPQTGPALINVYHYGGHLDAAFDLLSKNPPLDPPGLFDLAWFLVYRKGIREAEEAVETTIDDPKNNVMWQLYYLLKCAAKGDRGGFSRWLTPPLIYTVGRDPQYSSLMADFYALLGDPEKAMDWLENAVSRGFINYPYLLNGDPYLRTIRGQARFQRLMDKIKPAWEQFEE